MTLSDLLPPDISLLTLGMLMAVALVASITRGFSGFGAALIFMPLASTLAAPRLVAAVLLLIDFVAAAPLTPNAWRLANRGAVGVMVSGAAVGVPIGTWALAQFDPLVTRWIVSGLVISLLVLLMSGWRYTGKERTLITCGVGLVSGLGTGLAQTGGPPIVAYWLGRPITTTVARANVVLFFTATNIFSIASYFIGELLTIDALKLAAIIGPVYGIGLYLGARMFGLASETTFRRVCYTLIALAAVVSLPLLDGILR
jgi:uncharacterized membrane protein YfcA